MDLREYLFRNRLTVTQFAKMMGCHKQTIYAIKSGRIKCSRWFAAEISRLTEGQVDVSNYTMKDTGITL